MLFSSLPQWRTVLRSTRERDLSKRRMVLLVKGHPCLIVQVTMNTGIRRPWTS
jgi:hypothetical protein